ncbi:helix-turn-helix domain-containing protein [Chitinophaga defluvii]|uniref:Helix-turn-helix domain-containing protein n=1 Tax=Chitinophaga defluvii TaxID=3163343 RepID=A0ABV2T6S3_9BACT
MENLILSPIPLEQLKAVICDSVRMELSKRLDSINQPNQTELITRKEAAVFLGISLPTLSDFTKTGKIVGYRIGTRVRYKRAELEQALNEIKSIKTRRG